MFFIITIFFSGMLYTMTSNLSLGPPSPTSLTSAVRGHFRYVPDMASQQAEAVQEWSQVTIFIQPGVKPDPQVTFSLTSTCSLMALRLECS